VTGKEYPKERGVECSAKESPEHPGVRMVSKPRAGVPPIPPGAPPRELKSSAETKALRKTADNVRSYADCLVERVQAGVITAGDALKELREEAKQWDWTAEQKKYVKNRLQGKVAEKHGVSYEKALEILDELEARVLPGVRGKRPFDRGRTPAQDVVSGGGVKARGVRIAQGAEAWRGYLSQLKAENPDTYGEAVEQLKEDRLAANQILWELPTADALEQVAIIKEMDEVIAEHDPDVYWLGFDNLLAYDLDSFEKYLNEAIGRGLAATPVFEAMTEVTQTAEASRTRLSQQDIATLLKELPRAQAQSLIRTLDDPGILAEVLEGLGKGDDTSDARQWLISAPGADEGLLAMYADDPDSSNRLLGLREMAARYPGADLSSWFEDPFPYIAQTAKELQPGGEEERVGLPEVPAPAPLETTPVPLAGEKRQAAPELPGTAPPEFPERPEPPEEEKKSTTRKRRKKGAIGVPIQLTLTYDTPNEQYVMYDLDYGLISPEGAREKEIRGQLQAFSVQDDMISEALKEAKENIVLIRVAQGAPGDVQELIKDAVQIVITQLSPEAPRANLMMAVMDEVAKATSPVDAEQLQGQIKEVLNQELEMYPRPEIPGTHQEFMQVAGDAVKTGRTYEPEEKKEHIKDFGKHGIPLQVEFEKKPPEDIPPNRQLSTAESRYGFAVGDRVRDQALPELTGTIDGFGIGNIIKVAMDASSYCPEGGIGIYAPEGLIKIS